MVQLSAEDVLRCYKDCTENTNACDGGSTSEAWECWTNECVVSGGNYNSKEVRLFVDKTVSSGLVASICVQYQKLIYDSCVPYSCSSYNGHNTNV
jgi:hypothetical protein